MHNRLLLLLLLFVLFSCKKESQKTNPKPKTIITVKTTDKKQDQEIQYSEKELITFMDSIAKLPSKPLQDKVSFNTDSSFKSQENINKLLTANEFKQLKQGIKSEKINIALAKSIFGKSSIDSLNIDQGKVAIQIFSFDRNKTDYNEFAVILGWPVEFSPNQVYFFKSNKLITKLNIYFRYDFELKHYRDNDGKTIVYFKQNFESGSGVWWYNYFFYKYYDDKLIPVLNELENANLTWPQCRYLWLKSTIVKTNPLTFKMVYRQQFNFNDGPGPGPEKTPYIVNDSTFVKYNWDEQSKSLIPDYAHSKINKAEILTYYLEDNELLFINTFYKTLKKGMDNPSFRKELMLYLNAVKNRK